MTATLPLWSLYCRCFKTTHTEHLKCCLTYTHARTKAQILSSVHRMSRQGLSWQPPWALSRTEISPPALGTGTATREDWKCQRDTAPSQGQIPWPIAWLSPLTCCVHEAPAAQPCWSSPPYPEREGSHLHLQPSSTNTEAQVQSLLTSEELLTYSKLFNYLNYLQDYRIKIHVDLSWQCILKRSK